MTPDLPKNPREELEARLTALLLGELPADEAAALRQAIAQDPELANLYARLEHTIELVRETAASPAEAAADQPAPLQLAGERREKLLAHFKTIAPKEFAKPRRREVSWMVPMAAAAAFMLLLVAIAMPNFVRSRATSQSNAIINNLRQLDGAKQQWALENNKSADDKPTMSDLAHYLKGAGAQPPSIAGESYALGRVGEPATAEVDSSQAKNIFDGRFGPQPPARASRGRVLLSSDGVVTATTDQTQSRLAADASLRRTRTETVRQGFEGHRAAEDAFDFATTGSGARTKSTSSGSEAAHEQQVHRVTPWQTVRVEPSAVPANPAPRPTLSPVALPSGGEVADATEGENVNRARTPWFASPKLRGFYDNSGGLKPDANGVAAASVPAKPADLELVGEPKATGALENQGVGSWEKNLSQLSTDADQSTARRFYRIQPGAGGGGGGGAGNPALKSEISDLKWGLSGNGAGTANQPSAERTGKSDIYTGVTGDNVVGLRLLTPTPAAPPPASLPSLVPSPEVVVAPPLMSSPINPETVSAKVDQPAKGAITGFAHGIDPSTPPPPVPGAVFLGYDDPGKFVPQALAASGGTVGVPVTSQLPLPHWRVGDKDFYGEPEGSKTPFLGDMPLVGRLFRSESGPADDWAKSSSTHGPARPDLAAGKPVDVDFDTSAGFDAAAARKLGLNKPGESALSFSAANSFGGGQVSGLKNTVNAGAVVNAGTLALGERKELGSTTLSGYVDSSAQWNIGTGNAITTPIGGGPSGYDVSVWSDNTAVKTTGFANIGGDQQKPEPQVAVPRSKTDGFNQNVTTPAQVEAKPQSVELAYQVGHEPAQAGAYSFQLAHADPQQTKALLEDPFKKDSNTSNTRGGSPSESPSLARRRAGGSGGNQSSIALPSATTEGRAAGEATFSIDQDSHKLVVVADEKTRKYVSQIVPELDSNTKGTPHPSANRPTEASRTEERLMLGRHDDAARPVSKAEPAPQDSLLTSGLRIPATKAAKEEPARRKLAEVTKQPSEGKSAEDRAKAATKVRDAAVLFELGKLDESAAKLKEAIKTDPANQQAYYYVNLIQESQYKEAQKKRDVSSRHSLVEVEEAWFTPPKHELVTAPNSFARSTQIASSKGSNNIAKKLDQIHLGSVKYEGLPLSEVIYSLNDESKKRDPDKRGLNFIIAPGILSAAGTNGTPSPVDPATGLPAAAAAPAEDQDLGAVQVKIAKPLGDVRLVDALDAIVKAADKPIKYSIEDYGVVFSPAGPAPERKKEPDLPKQTRPAAPAAEPQPEVQTCDNAFSTFSLNISDVSFKLAMASLEKGLIPEAASVRSEEFLNAFDYRDPEPPPGAPIGFAWERARYPYAQNRDLLRFSLKTAALGRQPGRPLNLVLLLDNSGSMERADRVRIIHEALRVLAGQLQAQDKFSVVTFSRTARLIVDGVSGNEAGRVVEEISGLTPQGGTNLEDAMNTAYATALRHYLANGVNRVVLLTDGAANLGNVEPDALKQKVEAHRKQGIALDCFGIGWEGYNDDLLEVLSRNGDGRYGFINTPEEATTEFASQLAGALHVAASDVKVQIEFNPKRVTAYRQIGYAKHQLTKQQFRDNTVDAAEIAAAEAGNALYVVEVNPRGEGPLGTVRVRYKVPGTTDYHEHEWEAPYTGNAVALEQASPAMRLAATSSAFSEWLVSSPYAGEVTPDNLLGYLSGVPEVYGADIRPKKLEWMIRQAKSVVGK